MRRRITRETRRGEILFHARRLFEAKGFAGVDMADIHNSAGISRGGLYHHFPSKAAVLDGLVAEEVKALARQVEKTADAPLETLLEAGSVHLGAASGVLSALAGEQELGLYLASLERALTRLLAPVLARALGGHLRPGANAAHVAELFLVVNAHVNARALLGDWDEAQARAFAATALTALAGFFTAPESLGAIAKRLTTESP